MPSINSTESKVPSSKASQGAGTGSSCGLIVNQSSRVLERRSDSVAGTKLNEERVMNQGHSDHFWYIPCAPGEASNVISV
jgi:hypothetical protein